MKYHFSISILLYFTFPGVIETYKVLVFNPAFGVSHSNFLGKISDILIDAGHDVTMLIPILLQSKKDLIGSDKMQKVIRIPQDPRSIAMYAEARTEEELRKKIWTMDSDVSVFLKLIGNFSTACGYQYIFQQTEILEKLREEKFDLAITERLLICGYPLFNHLNIQKVINADSTLFMVAVKNALGEPASTSFYPGLIIEQFSPYSCFAGLFSAQTDKMSLLGRVRNLAGMLVSLYFTEVRFEKELKAIEAYYKGRKSWREHLAGAVFNFVNSNRYLDYASPTLPKTVFVGGMQVNTKKNGKVQLAKEWDHLLSKRKQNVLVSFGSIAHSSEMPDEFKTAFLEVFESMPDTTFIWKYEIENASLADHLENVHLTKWMPQNDLLADNRLTLFVTHGGLGSSIELAYQGTPAVVIPLMADQPRNAHMLTRHGGALQLDKTNLDKPEEIKKAIQTVLNNPEYKKNAQRLAQILAEQPNQPKDVVLKHCDFAVKFGALETLNSEGRHLNTFQFYCYDIFAVFCVLLSLVLIVIVTIVRTCVKLAVKRGSDEKSKIE